VTGGGSNSQSSNDASSSSSSHHSDPNNTSVSSHYPSTFKGITIETTQASSQFDYISIHEIQASKQIIKSMNDYSSKVRDCMDSSLESTSLPWAEVLLQMSFEGSGLMVALIPLLQLNP